MPLPLVAPTPEPAGAAAQLATLGTKLEYLHPVLYAGEAARRTATPNHPANTAGTRAYQEHVRVLREEHIRNEGWQRLLHDHLELVYNPEKSIAIGVMIGDAATGNHRHPPTNLRKRGAATARAAERNSDQLELFLPPPGPDEAVLSDDEAEALQVWFLVSYRVQAGDAVHIHSELSLPAQVENGFVVAWKQRIPLPVLEMDGIEPPDEDGQEEIDIPVDFR
ncbi:hypothetical protein OHR86_12545 [Streptomyces sp. NBC_00441]|uniref:hypothetical protein n=1 Tax=Streptomyces sp. NBC_00441 TaxID=2975742 RepID=UPI002E28F8A6|nr:hypothetical protein [Streptomyces sp. NBC_00441]